jgi:hypothetical protein
MAARHVFWCGKTRDDIPSLVMTAGDSERPALYHYTDANGLLGIVNPLMSSWPINVENSKEVFSGTVKLFASDVRFMNDTEELKFGARILRERLDAVVADTATPQEYRNMFAETRIFFDEGHFWEWPLRCFASCFCQEGDLLSQWRGYAGGVGGFALGVSRDGLTSRSYVFDRLSEPPPFNSPSSAALSRVVYGEEEGAAAADQVIQQLIWGEFPRAVLAGPQTPSLPQKRRFLYSALFRTVATIKAKSFEEEKEWRLFSSNFENKPVNVRAGKRGLVPYMEVAVNLLPNEPVDEVEHTTASHPTIVDLVVGPGPDQAGQVVAARELMRSTGRNPDVVRASEISYRG